MGLEATCRATWGKQKSEGKAQYEMGVLLFRGEFRLKVPAAEMKSLAAKDGKLCFTFDGEKVVVEIGDAAVKWLDKIQNPPTLLDKLGVKAETKVAIEGMLDAEFLKTLKQKPDAVTTADVVFLAADDMNGLKRVPALAAKLGPTAALWIIYPKGRKDIREADVMNAGRGAGLKDAKVCSFSATHTGLKFIVPLAKR